MKAYNKRLGLSQRRVLLLGAVAFVSCWSVSTPAQRAEYSPVPAHLAASAMSREADRDSLGEPVADGLTFNGQAIPPLLPPQHSLTDAEAWQRFEAEYSPLHPSPSLVKQQIEAAKYDVDTIVFAVDHFVKTIENHVDFTFENGGFHSTRTASLTEAQNHPRVKLDIDIAEDNKPYFVGVRVVIPVGD